MKKVLCIAEVCCDMIFAGLPRVPNLGEEVYGDEFVIKPGGGANTPINLGRVGVPTAILTQIGDDDMGRMVFDTLRNAGVRVQGKICRPGTRTPVSAVLSTAADRCFASYGGRGEIPFDEADLEEAIRSTDLVHTYLGYCFGYPIFQLCEKYGKELSLDVSWCDTENSHMAREMLTHCDYLKLNDVEAMRLTGCDTPRAALGELSRLVRKAVVVTLGSEGSIGMPGREAPIEKKVISCGAVSCGEFRDACGAGDSFAAGFLYGISRGETLEKSMFCGALLAGQSVTWYGGNDETLNCTKIEAAFQA